MGITLEFAKDELNKYYELTTGKKTCDIKLIAEDYKLNSPFDDRFDIDVTCGKGQIKGANERSVLLGVYKMFECLGVRFFRTTSEGEKIVKIAEEDFTVNMTFVPSYRHRGITIEGANSLESILALIDWLPKAGFNSYFIQFRNGYQFFERWYNHVGNCVLQPEGFSQSRMDEIMEKILHEIKKRGLIYHAVGHGWTCECLGLSYNGWYEYTDEIPPYIKEKLALVNGERKFFGDIPLNTHLCYSQQEVRTLMADEVVSYLENHPEIDILHFWLADNFNNICECEQCQKDTLSDYYVQILNDIDEKLTAKNIPTKIVFLIYFELLWSPKKERIKNPDRFVLMFAPISRTYSKPLLENVELKALDMIDIPAFNLNKNVYSAETEVYLNFLNKWKKIFSGDSFDFDYHLMWDIYRDYGGSRLAKVLYKDIVSLKDINLNGYISCQIQRAFFPNGLCMYVMAKTLCDRNLDYNAIETEYYAAAFGDNYPVAKRAFEDISELVSFEWLRGEKPINDKDVVENIKKLLLMLPSHIENVKDIDAEGTDRKSFDNLLFLLEYLQKLLPVLVKKGEGLSYKDIKKDYESAKEFFDSNEYRFQYIVDGYDLNQMIGGFIEYDSEGNA